jgi:ATP-dependent RNA helicase DDX56/DBP9
MPLLTTPQNYNQTITTAMKRKLDDHDVPAPVAEEEKAEKAEKAVKDKSFTGLGLDPRLLQAIAKQNFTEPTLVQRKAIPLAIQGKDILARAKTGSGKTAAYLLPILHSILKRKEVRFHSHCFGVISANPDTDLFRFFHNRSHPRTYS